MKIETSKTEVREHLVREKESAELTIFRTRRWRMVNALPEIETLPNDSGTAAAASVAGHKEGQE
jgi:hypothetical protein